MTKHDSGPREAVEGIVEDVKGKAKEAAGIVTGDESLKSEGRAQQDKAESEREAAKKEAEAEKARAEAKLDEARQSAYQSGKEADNS
ncbi:CsbD family protein [Nocardia vulneris]|uniref:General stress protein CsbD n=1 Tax=Nocardia vulneris TaxID=1141657 RepID=A0ABR4Z3P4_9NOCA|nr:CsbD family protein [Nocardia vulneris]KIA59960.1 general stress protein CsbD [Nocardia vulneris]